MAESGSSAARRAAEARSSPLKWRSMLDTAALSSEAMCQTQSGPASHISSTMTRRVSGLCSSCASVSRRISIPRPFHQTRSRLCCQSCCLPYGLMAKLPRATFVFICFAFSHGRGPRTSSVLRNLRDGAPRTSVRRGCRDEFRSERRELIVVVGRQGGGGDGLLPALACHHIRADVALLLRVAPVRREQRSDR